MVICSILELVQKESGHSLKGMGRKLSAVSLLGINAEDILKQVR